MGTHFIHRKDIFERGPHGVYRLRNPGPFCCLTPKSNMAAEITWCPGNGSGLGHPVSIKFFLSVGTILLQIAVSIVYFGLALNSGDLGGSVFINFFVGAVVEFPAYALCIFLLDRMGRKKLHATVMTIGGLSCLATMIPILMSNADTGYRWVILILAMIGKLGITSAFGVVYLYSCELFPTVLRNSAMGMFSTCGRIGAVLAPYIADLGDFIGGKEGRALPMLLFGLIAIVAGGLAQILPETKGRKLPDSIKDAEKMSRIKPKPQEIRLTTVQA